MVRGSKKTLIWLVRILLSILNTQLVLIKKKNLILFLSTLVLGIIVGISSLLLSLLLAEVEQLFLNFQESAANPASLLISPLHRMFSVFLGASVAEFIWWILRTKFKQTVPIAKAISGKNMPAVQTTIHVMTQIFYVATGGSVGRELAPREAGAMLAQRWNYFLKKINFSLSMSDQKLLIAAAAGAGFAGVYGAPLTGMLFCVEVLLKDVSKKTVAVSLVMSSTSMLIGTIFKGIGPYYLVGKQNFSLKFLLFVIFAAPICGLAGAFFRQAFKWAGYKQTKDKNILWQLPLTGLLMGVIATVFPEIMGNGRALAQLSIDTINHKFLLLLLVGAIIKAVVTVLTIKSGASGGTLTPSISIGAVMGTIFGLMLQNFFPGLSQCSLLAASQ